MYKNSKIKLNSKEYLWVMFISKKLILINMNEISNIQTIWNMIYTSTFFTEIQKNKLKDVLYNICVKFINYKNLGVCSSKTYKNYQLKMNNLFKDFIIPFLKSKYNIKIDGFYYINNNNTYNINLL